VNEREFTKSVIAVAQTYGWRIVHFLPARVGRENRPLTAYLGDGRGFPDLVAVKASRLLFAELKVGRNKTTSHQDEWAQALLLTGVEMYLWTPDDLDDISRILGPQGCSWPTA
jgi:hypothetical protein